MRGYIRKKLAVTIICHSLQPYLVLPFLVRDLSSHLSRTIRDVTENETF